jgi:hypothetical protein
MPPAAFTPAQMPRLRRFAAAGLRRDAASFSPLPFSLLSMRLSPFHAIAGFRLLSAFDCCHAIIFNISLRFLSSPISFSPPKIVFVDSDYVFISFSLSQLFLRHYWLIIATLSLLRYYDNIFAIASFIVFHYFRHFACTLPFFAWLFAIIS